MPEPAPIALTCGDPAGIGPEIALRLLEENAGTAREACLVGPGAWLEMARAAVGPELRGVAVDGDDTRHVPGEPTDAGARLALAAMEEAAAGCREGRYRAVVTGPVSKARLQAVGYRFAGQTEFFAARWGGTPTMAFAGGRLRVVLASWHIPLREVPDALTAEAVERACRRAHELARALGCAAPRIGLCGLNPHAGEGGLLGTEERDRLDPLAERLRAELPGLSPCQPADTVFFRSLEGTYDVIVALYHDQGLAPLKTLEFERSVNLTLGLPYVRTSPDHGTAFEIAGRGSARHTSLANAFELARRLSAGKEASM